MKDVINDIATAGRLVFSFLKRFWGILLEGISSSGLPSGDLCMATTTQGDCVVGEVCFIKMMLFDLVGREEVFASSTLEGGVFGLPVYPTAFLDALHGFRNCPRGDSKLMLDIPIRFAFGIPVPDLFFFIFSAFHANPRYILKSNKSKAIGKQFYFQRCFPLLTFVEPSNRI